MRTKNSAEVYHKHIVVVFRRAHSTFRDFLQNLIDEKSNTHNDILQVIDDQSSKNKKK